MISKIFKRNSIYKDVILNIFAAGLTAVVLQFVIYPFFSSTTSVEIFGEILLMMSVVNIVAVLLGNSLNNIRLIFDGEYKTENTSGDFMILLALASLVNVIVMSVTTNLIWSENSKVENFYLVLISLLTMLKAYFLVGYRLNLNYIKILQHSIVYIISLILGILAFMLYEKWQIVFIIAELLSLIFIIKTTNLIKEPFVFTKKFKKTVVQYFYLSISSAISNLLIYMDRIIISIFLGTHQVAVFFAATVIGKMSSFILAPISSVVLSYISSKKRKITIKEFLFINIFLMIFSLVMGIFTYFISRYFLKILYPDIYLYTFDILMVANLAAILIASSAIPQAIILRYNPAQVQIYIQSFYGLFYIVGGILLITQTGLKGFSIAILIAALLKFVMLFFIGLASLRMKN